MFTRTLVLLLAAALGASAQTADRTSDKVLAVLEFDSKLEGAERKAVDVGYLSDTVRAAALDEIPNLRVMTRENIIVLLQASGKTLGDCQGECEVETGRKLGADLVISGGLLKFGSSFKLDLKLHDTHDGRLLSGATASGKTIDALDTATNAAVRKLLRPLLGGAAAADRDSPASEVNSHETTDREGTVREAEPNRTDSVHPASQPEASRGGDKDRDTDKDRDNDKDKDRKDKDRAARKDAESNALPLPSGARPLLTITTLLTGKSYTVEARVGARTFKCDRPVTDTAPCSIAGLPAGTVTLIIGGDAQATHEVSFGAEAINVNLDTRSRWPLWTGIGVGGFGVLALVAGGVATDPTVQADDLGAGVVCVGAGIGLLIYNGVRSSIGFKETNTPVAQSGLPHFELASLGIAPVHGGVAAGAILRF